jgi:hypothetical protein
MSPDAEDAALYPNLYPLTQQRPVIQSKLIIRKLLRLEETEASSSEKAEYPRKHPFPIQVTTNHKCLHFSEPIIMPPEEEEKDDDDDEHSKKTTPVNIPHYQRPEEQEQEQPSNTEAVLPIPSETRDDSYSVGHDDDNDNGEEIIVDIEIGGRTLDETPPPPALAFSDDENDDLLQGEGDIVIPMGGADGTADMDTVETKQIEESNNSTSAATEDDKGAAAAAAAEDLESHPPNDSEETPQPTTTTTVDDDTDYFGVSEWRDRGTACDICLLEYQVGEEVAWSPNLECSHSYHKDCVLDWLVRKPTCPNCRHDYLKGKGDEEDV